MVNKKSSNKARLKRHMRIRKKIHGTAERPRLSVYRSLKNMYAQLIDDENGVTIVSASSLKDDSYGGNVDAAKEVGKKLAEAAAAKGIKSVVFDRSGYLYHGRVAALAEGAREGGLEF